MFWRRDWEEEISGSRESPFLECRHLLFEEEAGLEVNIKRVRRLMKEIGPRSTRRGTEGILCALRFLVLDAREHSGPEGAEAQRHRNGEEDVESSLPLQG